MDNLKFAVLGPIPRDHITTHRGEEIQKYGCVTHTAIALSNLLSEFGFVYPVTHIREKDKKEILKIFKSYDNINADFIDSTKDQGDIIQLKFVDQNKRLERQTGFMNPILPEDLQDLLDCHAFVCVPVTDYEVPLATLKYIKANSNGIIVFDAHGPTTALTTKGQRLTKFWVDRDQWLPYIDVLKMNLEEANCSWFQKEYPTDSLQENEEIDKEELPHFARHCLSKGLKALFVTLDADGVMAYTMNNGQLDEKWIPSVKVDHVIDTTGCGDSFAAGLTFGLVRYGGDIEKAAQFGNAMGAQRTQGKTFKVFKSLEETIQMIQKNYPQ